MSFSNLPSTYFVLFIEFTVLCAYCRTFNHHCKNTIEVEGSVNVILSLAVHVESICTQIVGQSGVIVLCSPLLHRRKGQRWMT